jgi:oligopeptide/dipeptide ABC transporter ATP-binding protein
MEPLLELQGITKTFASGSVFRRGKSLFALENVDISLRPGEILGILGESGSGKSTLGRVIARLTQQSGGELKLRGLEPMGPQAKGTPFSYRARVQMVFQDAYASLNPVHKISHPLERALQLHHPASRSEIRSKAASLLEQVGLRPGEVFLDKYPHELSGGQRQRVAIARALAVQPDLIIADEPTSMLDVSIRMDVLNLIRSLRDERKLSVILITHDLPSAWYVTDRLAVLYAGQVVEEGPTREITAHPAHPYTHLLLRVSAERIISTHKRAVGQALRSAQLREAAGCLFAARCPFADDNCRKKVPELQQIPGTERRVRCFKPLYIGPELPSHSRSLS